MGTPNYGWTVPTVGADNDAWGTILNTAFDDIDGDLKAVSDVASAALTLFFPGIIVAYGGATAPAGWMICDGSAISRTTYDDLFAAIGTAYGVGNGSTTFNIPDLRGEFVRGNDNGRGADPARVLGSAQTDELEAHSHSITTVGTTVRGNGGQDTAIVTGSGSTSSTGGAETRPRNVSANYIIRV